VLFGVLAGYVLRAAPRTALQARVMLVLALRARAVGLVLSQWIPISKPLWTPSFAIFMAGLSSACMAFWIWIADLRQWVRWLKPLEIFGMNAIAALYRLHGGRNVAKVHLFGKSLYEDVCRAIASPENASLI
jgi:predicted acyltransferase